MQGRLDGKVAVVLGASAEAGTGWAIAKALAGAGAKVVIAARRPAELQVRARAIGATAVVCDAAQESQVKDLAEAALREHGKLDIAVNAAFSAVGSTIADASREMLIAPMEVNYFGNVYFVKHMAKAIESDGSIVLISSSSAQNTMLPYFPYACSKAALDCLVRYAALEYGPKRIRVNSILPGAIRSEAARELWATPGMEELFSRDVPLGRIGEPADFADAVLWLASATYVTGLNVPVSGGLHLTRSPLPSELPGWQGVSSD
jgi:NAD(P)-dependent dehydrogenase (short-subunit alcohol dehydrogenase family)